MALRDTLHALPRAFLGSSPAWYKATIVVFLAMNPLAFWLAGPFAAGWLLVGEFIFTLAMALRCYPLQPGGLLAIEAVALGMTSAGAVYEEVLHDVPVLLLLMFMVAGIHFLQDLLVVSFTRILLGVRSKLFLSLVFCASAALLSAFLDALTVIAVVIAVAAGFYGIYHRFVSGRHPEEEHHDSDDSQVSDLHREDLDQFRAFLRNLVMHAAVGTALGGALTLVGEPQNLLIGKAVGWHFLEFFVRMAPVTVPVLLGGLATCTIVERFSLFGYGARLPDSVRTILVAHAQREREHRTPAEVLDIVVQAVVAVLLILGLAFHVAEIGLIGLVVLVVATAFQGVTEEHRLGRAFTESLPFTALLVVFFTIVAVIHEAHLFEPILGWALSLQGGKQLAAFYGANAVLSIMSDNVFVATVYMSSTVKAMEAGQISHDRLELLAMAINAGTNLPSVATPNGQAGFLFLLTSALAPRIRLSYGRMVWLALPYAIGMTLVGLLAVLRLAR
jgi:NhaB family Na+:H+ antiporter